MALALKLFLDLIWLLSNKEWLKLKLKNTRWWFQVSSNIVVMFRYVHPYLGKWSHLTCAYVSNEWVEIQTNQPEQISKYCHNESTFGIPMWRTNGHLGRNPSIRGKTWNHGGFDVPPWVNGYGQECGGPQAGCCCWGPEGRVFFRGTEIFLQKKKAKFWQAFLVAGTERKFEEKLSKSDAKVLRNCLRRV